jgi:hypothetical protein
MILRPPDLRCNLSRHSRTGRLTTVRFKGRVGAFLMGHFYSAGEAESVQCADLYSAGVTPIIRLNAFPKALLVS